MQKSRSKQGGDRRKKKKKGARGDARRGYTRQRSAHYPEWWPDEEIKRGVAEGRVVTGCLRISKKRRSDAFVHDAALPSDVFVEGEVSRNRSLNGDVVAVELLPVEKWREKAVASGDLAEALSALAMGQTTEAENPLWRPLPVPPEAELKQRAAGPPAAPAEGGAAAASTSTSSASPPLPPPGSLAAEMAANPGCQPCGIVVGILAASESSAMGDERLRARDHVGVLVPRGGCKCLKPGQPVPAKDTVVQFQPLDKRIPWMMVPRHQAPHAFLSDPLSYTRPRQKLWVCAMGDWPAQHRFPQGRLVRQVGQAGDIEPETEALLVEHNVDHGE